MTVLLKNTSEKKAITLRYGDGLNKMLQLNPKEEKPLPTALHKGLLQHYLSTFNGDLKVIDSNKPSKVKAEGDNDEVKTKDETGTKISQEKDEASNGTKSTEDDLSNEPDSETGDDDSTKGDTVGSSENDSEDSGDQGSTEDSSDNSDKGESEDNDDQGSTEDNQNDNNDPVAYDEKTLTKLSAEEVKKVAASLGIEVTEESTKKALIPVILDKQGK